MSGLVKGVKKVFKKAVKFVKKYWKEIVIAAAVYFTAGVALAAMPSTAAFSAAMPGFGTGAIFSKAAVAMGATGAAGSGIAGTVAANAAVAAGSAASVAAGSAAAGGSGLGAAAGTGGSIMPGAVGSATTGAMVAAPTATAAGTTGAAAASSSGIVASMSGLEKVALASTAFKGVGGLLSDSEDDINKKQHNREYGNAMGVGRDGTGPGYGGVVKDAWGDRFGDSGDSPFGGQQDENTAQAAPASPGAYNDSGDSPFGVGEQMTSQSEAQGAADQQMISGGYRNKNYSPV